MESGLNSFLAYLSPLKQSFLQQAETQMAHVRHFSLPVAHFSYGIGRQVSRIVMGLPDLVTGKACEPCLVSLLRQKISPLVAGTGS